MLKPTARLLSLSLTFFTHFLFSKRGGSLIKIIAWLSVLGIGTGVFALVVVMSVMNGFNTAIRTRTLSVEPHLVINVGAASPEAEQKAVEWLKEKKFTFDYTDTQDVILRTQSGTVQGAIAQGVSQATLNQIIEGNRKRQSRDLGEPSEYKLAGGEVIVGMGLGDTLGLFENDPLVVIAPESLLGSKEALPLFETVKVKDFLRTEIEGIDSHKIYYVRSSTLGRLQRSASLEKTIEVRLPNAEEYEDSKKTLESMDLKVESWKDRNSNLFYSLKLEKFVVALLLGLSTIIASFSLVTLMVIMVTQKKKDIGVLMAMGFDAQLVTRIFQLMGVAVSMVGILGGILLGLPTCYILENYSQGMLPAIYADTNIPAEVHASQILLLLIISIVVTTGISWLAVRRITKLTPVDALRSI